MRQDKKSIISVITLMCFFFLPTTLFAQEVIEYTYDTEGSVYIDPTLPIPEAYYRIEGNSSSGGIASGGSDTPRSFTVIPNHENRTFKVIETPISDEDNQAARYARLEMYPTIDLPEDLTPDDINYLIAKQLREHPEQFLLNLFYSAIFLKTGTALPMA